LLQKGPYVIGFVEDALDELPEVHLFGCLLEEALVKTQIVISPHAVHAGLQFQ
jgi:hypothetical protein